MLIQCPECELQVSDKAVDCPHCGYPMKPDVVTKKRKKSNRRKRLPNGFGQITELKGRNLRKPFRAMVTVGKDEKGKPICKLLQPVAYFATYNEAYAALAEYNRNPYDLDKATMTMQKLYDDWSAVHFQKISKSTKNTHKSAWKYCTSIYNMKVCDIRARHLKTCIDKCSIEVNGKTHRPSDNIKNNIKALFNLMLDFAVEYELIDKNYSRDFSTQTSNMRRNNKKQKHLSFTDQEIEKLWSNVDKVDYTDMVLIQCYSGWRPQEMGLIKIENVDLKNWFFSGGIKTESGKNRIVPIHPKIRNLVLNKYKEACSLNSKYLINCTDVKKGVKFTMNYNRYADRFNRVMNTLNFENHRPHDGRKHFVTQAKKYNVDEYAIKYMVGHVIEDITESVYTERSKEWLQKEMQKIK